MAQTSSRNVVYRSSLALLACLLAGAALLAPGHANAGRVHPGLEARLASLPPGTFVPVIVELEEQANPAAATSHLAGSNRRERGRAVVEALREMAARTQPPVLAMLGGEQAQGTVLEVRPFWVFNGLAVSATEAAIRRIASRQDVREVHYDAPIPPPIRKPAVTAAPTVSTEAAWNIAQIRAPEVWALAPAYNGTGIVIGSFDTGVDGTHPDLAPRYRGNDAISWFDPYHQHATPFDNNGHGTHTTGTALGGDASGYNIGVAPGARWIAAKAWNDRDAATESAFHQIFEWFLAPGGDPANAPDVVNSSWGQAPPDCYTDFLADVRAMRAAGIFPSFASGNEGPDASTALGPGNVAEAFSVGATEFDDFMADFSSRGPSQCDGAIKPDIAAPGVAILSSLPGDFYFELDGTSMATPHVTGAAAVLLSIDPTLSVDDIESALVLGAVDIDAPGPDNAAGAGRLDLLASAGIVLGKPLVGIKATTPDAREAGLVAGKFTVTRNGSLADPLTVAYTVAGTATPGADYVALPGSVTFPAGVASVDIAVTPIDDDLAELDETVVVTLGTNPVYLVAPAAATVRIVSNELLPDLTVSALSAPGATAAGAAVAVSDTTKNAGGSAAPASTTHFYLSTNSTLDAADVLLGSRPVAALAPGTTDSGSTTVTIPATAASGSYYLIAKADGDGALAESSETNNTTYRALSIGPDLTVSTLTAPTTSGAGIPFDVTDTTKNAGGSAAPATTTRFYLSTNGALDAADVPLGSRAVPALAPGATDSGSTTLTIPIGTATGNYYLFARADSEDLVAEASEANNTAYRSLTIGPDLTVSSLIVPSRTAAGAAVAVSDTTKNAGGGAAPATITRFYLSANSTLDAADVLLGSRAVAALAPGAIDTGSTTVTIPAGTASGSYYLIAKADGDDGVVETQESNNILSRALSIGADLVVTSLTVPGVAGAGLALTISDTTANQGGSAAGGFNIAYYLSANSVLDAADILLGNRAVTALAAGTSSTGSVSVTIPPGTPTGAYYLFARADSEGAVAEASEANNTIYRTLSIGPDLTVSALSAPSTAGAGAAVAVSDTTKNAGGGAAPATTTRFYLSTNGTLDAADVLLGSRAVAALAPGAIDSGSTTLTIPAGTASGTYYLIAKADGDDALVETQETNNLLSRALSIGADLVVSSLTTPSNAGAGLAITVSDTTTNQGGSAAGGFNIAYYLSANAVLDAADVVLGNRAVTGLAAGTSSTGSVSVTIPPGTATGTYYLFARADSEGAVAEASETNNNFYRVLSIGPDLTVSALSAPATSGAGVSFDVTDTTKNAGGGAAPATTTRFYLSTNSTLDAADVLLGSRAVAALAPGAIDSGSTTLMIPAGTASASYYLIAKADGDGALAETSEANNNFYRVLSIGPDLTVSALSAPTTSGAGVSFDVTDTTKNAGGGAAPATTTRFYLSTNSTLDAADVLLGSRAVAALAPGAIDSGSTTLMIPAGTASASYYLIAKADGDDAVSETSETNNTYYRALSIGADLTVSALSAPTTSGAGVSFDVTDTTKNAGGGAAPASTTHFYLSTNSTLDAADVLLGSRPVAALAPGTTDSGSTTVTIPATAASGSYYLIAKADGDDAVSETSEANNNFYRVLSIGPDLTVSALSAPTTSGAGVSFDVTDTTKNAGGGAAPATTTRFYLSTNSTLDAADVLLGSRAVAALAPGAIDSGSTTLMIPAGTASASYYLIAKADGDDAVSETSEANNNSYRTLSIGPDLTVSALSAPTTSGAGVSFDVTDTTKNAGGGAAPATTTRFYLSTNSTLDAADVLLGSRAVAALAPGASNSGSVSLAIPAGTASGAYYLIAKADGDGALPETQETNNVFARALSIGPDLVVSALTVPSSAGAGLVITVSDTTKNAGGGAAPATITRFYLSANSTLDAADVLLGSRAVAALAPGAIDTGSTTVTIPAGTASGSYYLIAKADGDDGVVETQEFNNFFWRPVQITAP